MHRSVRFAAALAVAGPLTAQSSLGRPGPSEARIDSVFAEYDRRDSPGCALGVYRDGRIAYARGYGMADLEHAVPITPQTVFDIGSTSKQFTAASVALLAHDGKLSLDDDVRKYVPELPAYSQPITIRELLHHTSGLRDYLSLFALAGRRDEDWTTDDDALHILSRQRELNFPPGTEHDYSNSGFFVLSLVVKRASGTSLREFAARRIFGPLGMAHTLFRDDHTLVVPNRAVAYSRREKGGFGITMSDFEQTGDGAVHTTVEDLAKWDQNFYTPGVGGPELVRELLTPGVLANGTKLTYALGLYVDSYRGLRRVQHGGAWAGYRAQLARFPDRHTSVAVLCNLAESSPSKLADQVADIVLAGSLRDTAAVVKSRMRGQPRRVPALTPAMRRAFAPYAGLYWDERTASFRRVVVSDSGLVLDIGGFQLPLRSVAATEFVSDRYPVSVAFRPAAPGSPRTLEERFGGDHSVLRAVPTATPATSDLAAYAGSYRSDELETTWTLTTEKGVLTIHHPVLGTLPLVPAMERAFTAGPVLFQFTRDGASPASAFDATIGRARHIRFARR